MITSFLGCTIPLMQNQHLRCGNENIINNLLHISHYKCGGLSFCLTQTLFSMLATVKTYSSQQALSFTLSSSHPGLVVPQRARRGSEVNMLIEAVDCCEWLSVVLFTHATELSARRGEQASHSCVWKADIETWKLLYNISLGGISKTHRSALNEWALLLFLRVTRESRISLRTIWICACGCLLDLCI